MSWLLFFYTLRVNFTVVVAAQVGDFGLSKIKRNTLVSGGVRGTLPWMAPELLIQIFVEKDKMVEKKFFSLKTVFLQKLLRWDHGPS